MGYSFDSNRQYLMPTHFGPMAGPRHSPDGTRFPDPDNRIKETCAVSFLSTERALSALMPDGFELNGEPIVTVTFSYMTNIAWLAGRGYNMLGVTIPARIRSRSKNVVGPFLLVLWENMADPIITGREQLGFNKIYCDLPERAEYGGQTTCRASWMGHEFCVMRVRNTKPTAVTPKHAPAAGDESASMLHLRYIPDVGNWGKTLVCEPVVSPSSSGNLEVNRTGEGEVVFHETLWEDMPTQYHIVEGLRALPQVKNLGAVYQRVRGGTDHFFQQKVI